MTSEWRTRSIFYGERPYQVRKFSTKIQRRTQWHWPVQEDPPKPVLLDCDIWLCLHILQQAVLTPMALYCSPMALDSLEYWLSALREITRKRKCKWFLLRRSNQSDQQPQRCCPTSLRSILTCILHHGQLPLRTSTDHAIASV